MIQQSLNEQALKIGRKFKEHKAEWVKEFKDIFKQLSEHWNERFRVSKQEQFLKIK